MLQSETLDLSIFLKRLREAFMKRGYRIFNISPDADSPFNAFSKNRQYSDRRECVRVELYNERLFIFIRNADSGNLSITAQNAILNKFGSFFAVNSDGAVFRVIQSRPGAYCDLDEIANIVTRAYGLVLGV